MRYGLNSYNARNTTVIGEPSFDGTSSRKGGDLLGGDDAAQAVGSSPDSRPCVWAVVTPNCGHDRAQAATATMLCRFTAENGLPWRPLLAAIDGTTDRTVDIWGTEAHPPGFVNPFIRYREHDAGPPRSDRHTSPTITLVSTPSTTSNTNEAGEPAHDVEIIGTWSDGGPAETFAPLRAVSSRPGSPARHTRPLTG